MENKMENKILRLTTSSLFALQGAFAIFWSLYMYLEDNLRLTEAFVIGCILLLFALLFNFRKPIIKKTAYAVLVLYTVFFDVCGIMLIGVASPVIWIAWVIFFFLTSSLRHPKILVKEFSYFLMPCHQHCLGVNLLVQRQPNLYGCDSLCQCKDLVYAHLNL